MRDPKNVPFADWAEAVLGRSLARPQTIDGYRTWLARAASRIGRVPVGKVTEAHVREVLADARADGLSSKSLANLLGAVRMVLREAKSRAADGVRVRVPDPDVRPWSANEAEAARQALRPSNPADDAILALLGSGVRLAELERLRPQDWDAERQVARVASQVAGATKNGRAREVDVASYACGAVSRLVAGGVPARRTLRRRLDAVAREAGVPRIRVHDLRHTRITLLLLGAVPLPYVAAQAGHHDAAYTMRIYGHLAAASPEERRRWADAA